jgi:hypothetical protein
MTPLTKEVAELLAVTTPTPKPGGVELSKHMPPPAPPVAFQYP